MEDETGRMLVTHDEALNADNMLVGKHQYKRHLGNLWVNNTKTDF